MIAWLLIWAFLGALLMVCFIGAVCYLGVIGRVHRYVFFFLVAISGPVVWALIVIDFFESLKGKDDF